eukprot:CAMPEP_0176032220 /NCGR_PEP_ID=MMETSP0120_2-20121206/15900_1 /TAXON_ID=160619 /ORGANISM="Kryptoperidinium foliaceum, Strain CCMP 1326" /LENGTH=202 /DNA_ID=CAMNT_0017365533 /DNA_START=294 /DNA_END=899 /DNA_ORIENTATION=+
MKGEQFLVWSPGAWTLEFPPGRGQQGKASTLRFWMELQSAIEKQSIKFDEGEKLYFLCKAWREDDYQIGWKKLKPLQLRAAEMQRRLEAKLSHESGDRRLDGTDALQTLQAYGDMAQLVLERDQSRAELRQAREKYPSRPNFPQGPWPGAEEWLALSQSKNQNPIFVKRKANGVLGGEEFQVVGSWQAEPILSEDEYEVVDD